MKKKKKKKVGVPARVKGRGYCIPWTDGAFGWINANYVWGERASLRGTPHPFTGSPNAKPERAFLCEITIKAVTKRDGTPITRMVKP